MIDDNPFEPEETREQQDRRVGAMIRDGADNRAAAALVGRRVRFADEPSTASSYYVLSCAAGMVVLDGWSGTFSPYLFVTVDSDDPRFR